MEGNTQTAERKRKITALTALAMNYGKELPELLMLNWMRLLNDYTADMVETGVDIVIGEYEYKTMPPFAVLNKAIKKAYGFMEADESQAVAAHAEWERLLSAVSLYGRYNKPRLNDTTERVLCVMGGWGAVCNWTEDKLEWKCREFVEHWTRFAEYGDTMALPAADIVASNRLEGIVRHALQ